MINIAKKILYKLSNTKKEIFLVNPLEDKEFLIEFLSEETILGIDTEFDWRNTYFPNLCLLQIATKSKIFLIDCKRLDKVDYLKQLLEDKRKLIIFHSSRSDTTVLSTNLNIKIENVFDIQIAEKNISNGDIKNYGALVKKYFHINLKKTETNSNWLKRPFSQEQLAYAADDVNFLIEIYLKQTKILKKRRLEDKTLEECKKESKLGNKDLYISRLKRLKKPSKMEKNIFLWREKFASEANIPTSYVFKNKDLKEIAFLSQQENKSYEEIYRLFKNDLFSKAFIEFLEN